MSMGWQLVEILRNFENIAQENLTLKVVSE